MTLEETLAQIKPLDKNAMDVAAKRWDSIAKPLHSLGKMEKLVIQIAGITGNPDMKIQKRALVPMCADNGVVEEGVTQTGQEVTAIVAENFLSGDTSACVMSRQCGTKVIPVDIGMAVDTKVSKELKVAYGTANMTKGPAMTRAQVASVLLDRSVEEMTGRGAGLSGDGLNRKINAIRKAIEVNQPDPKDAIGVLAKVGGFDIAGMAGMFLGGAALGVPVVIDGFISCVAALIAQRICPLAGAYMIASHVSKEPAARLTLEALGKEAVIHGEMCLGEGSGAVTLFPFLDMGIAVYDSMSTFEDIHVEQYEELV